MKAFVIFVATIFSVLFLVYVYRDDSAHSDFDNSIKIYAPSSFNSTYGPGPELKKIFEKKTGQKVILLDMSDPSLLFQKIVADGVHAVGDLVLGLDQYDIVRFSEKVKWKPVVTDRLIVVPQALQGSIQSEFFLPYDWSAIALIVKNDFAIQVKNLNDLLKPELKNKIAYQDPRTSSPGLQMLMWIAQTKAESEAIEYLKALDRQAHSFSPSWSTAYGLFKNKEAQGVMSYMTSPIYHLVEENDDSFKAIEFKEGHPVQIEFAGILDTCKNCDGAYQFIHFLQTSEAQKMIMNKNYMMPIDKQVVDGTAFDSVRIFKLNKFNFLTKEDINKWIQIWSDIRQNHAQ